MSPDSFESAEPHSLGYNPYRSRDWERTSGSISANAWQEDVAPIAAIDFFKRATDEYLDAIMDGARPERKIVAQKLSIAPLLFFVNNIYEQRKLVLLVRDFRDVWLSARAFNVRRGLLDFERDRFQDDLTWMKGLSSTAKQMMLVHKSFAAEIHLVRYENIRREPATALKSLFEYLDISGSDDIVTSVLNSMNAKTETFVSGHRTSQSSDVHRWKTEMSQEEIDVAAEHYAEPLAYFGYEV